jgi:hypothetical protein
MVVLLARRFRLSDRSTRMYREIIGFAAFAAIAAAALMVLAVSSASAVNFSTKADWNVEPRLL